MPVALAVPLILLWAVMFLSAWLQTNQETVEPLVRSIVSKIPVVGGRLADAAIGMVNAALRPVEKWLDPKVMSMVHWIVAVNNVMRDLPAQVMHLAGDAADTLEHIVRHTIPDAIAADIKPVDKLAHKAVADAADALKGIDTLDDKLRHKIADTATAVEHELTHDFTVGIDRLRKDVLDDAIPKVRDEAIAAEKALGRAVDAAGQAAHGVRVDLDALAKRLGIPLTMIEAMIGVAGLDAALEAIQRIVTCRAKLGVLCTANPRSWERFIEGLALIALWPGLQKLTEDAGDLLEAHRDKVHDIIVHGG